jgi:hypothetical protein
MKVLAIVTLKPEASLETVAYASCSTPDANSPQEPRISFASSARSCYEGKRRKLMLSGRGIIRRDDEYQTRLNLGGCLKWSSWNCGLS